MSAVEDLRNNVLAGITGGTIPLAVLELADRVAAIEAKVFPPQAATTDPAEIVSQSITTERPQLSGS